MLTDTKLRTLKARPSAYRLADMNGLCIEVRPSGAKVWRYRYRYAGKASMITMAYTVERIIEAEGPIHEEEVIARVRDLWGLGRAGSRIQGAVQDALRHAARNGTLSIEDDCYLMEGAPVRVRDRSSAASRSLKKAELLPPQEIREAIVQLARASHGIRRSEIASAVARILGFLATSQQLRDRIEPEIDQLLIDGRMVADGDTLIVQIDQPSTA